METSMTDSEKLQQIIRLLQEALATIEKDPHKFHFDVYKQVKDWVEANQG